MPAFTDPQDCIACPRLAEHLANIRQRDPDWHVLPVPAFAPSMPNCLSSALVPAKKGRIVLAAIYRDVAGELLYPALHRFGFASAAEPLGPDNWANPAMQLHNCRITMLYAACPRPTSRPLPKSASAMAI